MNVGLDLLSHFKGPPPSVTSPWHHPLFPHQSSFNLRIFDVITWHPWQRHSSALTQPSDPLGPPQTRLSLSPTGELELSSSSWKFGVFCSERADQYRALSSPPLPDLENQSLLSEQRGAFACSSASHGSTTVQESQDRQLTLIIYYPRSG